MRCDVRNSRGRRIVNPDSTILVGKPVSLKRKGFRITS